MPIYLDHNASSPLADEARQAMLVCFDRGGNPSSLHGPGQWARQAIDEARLKVAALIGAHSDEIVFTSGGTEANNLALRGVIDRLAGRPHVVVSNVEHASVLQTCTALAEQGRLALSVLAADGQGRINANDLPPLLRADTALVALMLANNELGVLQPVAEAAALLRAHAPHARLHCDAVQAAGKIPVDVRALDVDLLALSAHKLGGPQGTGALYVRRKTALAAQLCGGGQELSRRSGTENVAGIAGFGAACERAREDVAQGRGFAGCGELRDRLEHGLLARLDGLRPLGHAAARLPNTSCLRVDGVERWALAVNLDLAGLCVSTGAACSSGSAEASATLRAIGVPETSGALRLSLGPQTTVAEVDRAVELIVEAVSRLRGRR